MRPLFIFVLALAVALPASAQNSATVQTETQTEARTETSTSSSAGGGTSSGTSSGGTVGSEGEAAVDAYLKIKGVDGESSEGKKGNVETEWKVEEGESAEGIEPERDGMGEDRSSEAKGSGEKGRTEDINIGVGELQGNAVSVNAVEVRGWDPKQKQEFLATVKAHAQVRSEQDLENFAKGVLLENEAVEELSLNFEKIQVKYRSSGKLFGFIPLTFAQRVEVDTGGEEAGRVKVKMPWFSFLLREDVSAGDIEEEAEASIRGDLGNNENWDFSAQAKIIASISNILKAKHEAAMNSIRNIK